MSCITIHCCSTSRYPLIDANMKELSATGFMSNRGRQVKFMIKISTNLWFLSWLNVDILFDRLYAHFLFETWALTGEWEQNGSRHVCWITTLVPTMETGPMEQVSARVILSNFFIICECFASTPSTSCSSLVSLGVGTDPREDRYFSIPKQVCVYFNFLNF